MGAEVDVAILGNVQIQGARQTPSPEHDLPCQCLDQTCALPVEMSRGQLHRLGNHQDPHTGLRWIRNRCHVTVSTQMGGQQTKGQQQDRQAGQAQPPIGTPALPAYG